MSHCFHNRHISVDLALLYQLQRAQIVRSVARQHVHRRFVPVKAPALALVTVAYLWIMHRHHPVLAHPVFQAHLAVSVQIIAVAGAISLHVLEQQLSQQLRCVNYRPTLPAVHRQAFLSLSGRFQQPVSSATICAKSLRRARRFDQSMPASPFTLDPT